MSLEMCRLCLSNVNLAPMFLNTEQSEKYSAVLELTTGLKILPDDGLPQRICAECTDLVDKSLKLRNRSNATDKLFKFGLEPSNPENTTAIAVKNERTTENNDSQDSPPTDSFDFEGIKIEIEMDRMSEDGGGKESEQAKGTPIQPKKVKRKKQKSALYMSLVEGVLDPNGPVQCKICKKSVSKWVCFINHAKKHLGYKVVCEFCGKDFFSSHQLKRHCRSYHGVERELKCKHCSFLALDKQQLGVHERRTHTGDRPYVCDACGASYFSRKCLLQHIESHRVTASVKCDRCDALFKSRRHLAKHKYATHSDKRRDRRREKRLAQRQDGVDPTS